MRHGSLFSGIGGFDLAAHWMGWQNVFTCEKDAFCQQVLHHHFPESDSYGDIRDLPAADYAGRIDIITGGVPCQPYSNAGKREGRTDDRYLWPEFVRVIRTVRPTWIVAENVRGFTNIEGGGIFGQVLSELEDAGYETFPALLPAAGWNAPHRRDRIWIIAHRNDGFCEQSNKEVRTGRNPANDGSAEAAANAYHTGKRGESGKVSEANGEVSERHYDAESGNADKRDAGAAAHPGSQRYSSEEYWKEEAGQPTKAHPGSRWAGFPAEAPVRSGNDGFPPELDGITFPRWRNQSIKAAGNAIVPQVALALFQTIQRMENEKNGKQ